MVPPLPQPVLEKIACILLEEARRVKSGAVMHSFPFVCKAWADAKFAVKYGAGNSLFKFSRDEGSGQVGDLCQPIAVPFVTALCLQDVPDDWLRDDLRHFTSTLIWLDCHLVGRPTAGLSTLPACTHLERLALICTPKYQGNLHDILDILRHLPTLTHLSLAHFHAHTLPLSAAKSSTPYTIPASLINLRLDTISGPRARDLLLQAFDPSFVFSLSALTLVNLGNALTLTLIETFHSTLTDLAYSLICPTFFDVGTLLPDVPFPRLSSLTLQVLPIQPPIPYIRTVNNLATFWVMQRVPDFHRLPLKRVFLVALDIWSDEEIKEALRAFRDSNHPSGMVRALAMAHPEILNETSYTPKQKIQMLAAAFLANVFQAQGCGCTDSLGQELQLIARVVLLAKGRELRKKKAEQEAKEKEE